MIRPHRRVLLSTLVFGVVCASVAVAQQKPTLKPADYGKWESLGSGTLSPDGGWLAYSVSRPSGKNELRIHKLSEKTPKVIASGTQPAFSEDARWLAYGIGYTEDEREQMEKAKKPIQNKVGIMNLVTGETTVIENIASFAFSDDGKYLALRGYAPQGRKSRGVDVFVRDLASGINTSFGNISNFAWREKGTLLAMTVDAENRSGNGVLLYDPATGALKTLDSGDATYAGLAWREKDDDLAVLRTAVHELYEDTSNLIIAWKDLATPKSVKKVFDHTVARGFPADTRVVPFRQLSWSDDGATVFFGIKERERKPAKAPVLAGGNTNNDGAQTKASTDSTTKRAQVEEPAGVEVWHARDIDIMPQQKVRANADRNRNFLAAWHLAADQFVQLGDELTEDVVLMRGQKVAIGRDHTPYERARMFGPEYRDLFAIDVLTGQKKKFSDQIEYANLQPSAEGRYALFLFDNHFQVYDFRTGATTNITKDVPANFINTDDDHTVKQKPPRGVGGWTKGDRSVLLYDKYDVWDVPVDGSKPTRLTDGAAEKIVHRVIRLDPEERAYDLSKPLYFSLYGERTKKSGYARKEPGKPARQLVWLDKNVGRLAKSKLAETYAYVVQGADDSPDYFVGASDLASARQVTETNPFQKDYAWTRTELVDYKNTHGKELQGSLSFPADYEPGKKYPMIVYFYEITSNTHHVYNTPSERSVYNPATWTQNGYFVLRPDIVYRDRNPGLSAVEALVPAVDAVLAKYDVDPKKVGLVGHSWGGYQTAFVPTQTNKFAAAVAGAPLTDLISMYLSIYWNTGGTDARIFEISQGRMEVPPWEDLESYMKNSALFNIKNLNTPMLVTFGDKDGAVDWHQGIELYNAARRENKDFVLLVYPDENHGLAKKPNQIDYHRRINQWFDHYLKGAPAPDWITKGVKFLDREKELKQLKKTEPPKPVTE